MPPNQMNVPFAMNTMAGAVDVVDVVQFASIMMKKHPGIIDAILTSVMEETIFGIEPKRISEKEWTIKKTVLHTDIAYGQSAIAGNMDVVESSYKTIEFPLEPIVNGDAEAVLISQLIRMVEPYPDQDKNRGFEDAIEMAACEALENFVNPTHIVRLTPNRVVALDIENFHVAIKDIDGNICISLFTEKVGALKGMEHTMM